MGTCIAPTSIAINADTEYTLRVRRLQRRVEFELLNADATTLLGGTSYDSSSDWGDGTFGMFSWNTGVKFDNYTVTRIDTGQTNPAAPRWVASAKTTLDTGNGKFTVESPERGGVSKLEWAGDDDYIAQADVHPNGGDDAELIVRYADPDNYYAAYINTNAVGTNGLGDVELRKVVRGKQSTVAAATYTLPQSWPITLMVGAPPPSSACPAAPWRRSAQSWSSVQRSRRSAPSIGGSPGASVPYLTVLRRLFRHRGDPGCLFGAARTRPVLPVDWSSAKAALPCQRESL